MKLAKERIIYNNMNLSEMYDDAKAWLIEEGNETPSENEIWDEIYFQNETNWEAEKDGLDKFFNGKTVGFFGSIGRWDGVYKGGRIGEFWDCYSKAVSDCDYVKIYDENGHLYLTCVHHDGSCHFEIKIIKERGVEYLNNWEYSYSDHRTKEQVYTQIFNRYSTLPRYAEKVFGCKAREYEPSTKEGLINKLNNQAKSFYT